MLSFKVLVIEIRSFSISSLSLYIESNSSFDRYDALLSSRNQYRDSLHSFSAIYILALKSSLLIPNSASAIFAPILVPLLSNCFERTYSRFCSLVVIYWYNFMMRSANSSLFSWTTLLIPHYSLLTNKTPVRVKCLLDVFLFQAFFWHMRQTEINHFSFLHIDRDYKLFKS